MTFAISEVTTFDELVKKCPISFSNPNNKWGELAFTMTMIRENVAEQHPHWPWLEKDQDQRVRSFVFIRNLARSRDGDFKSRTAIVCWLLSLTFQQPFKVT